MDKKSYLKWFPAAAVFPLLAAAWLLWGIGEARREAETMWLVTGEVWDREISSKELETMGEFPGLKQLWTVVRREAVLSLEGFQAETELNGVELESYPLEITRSGGKKYRGEKPLLVAGEDVFSALLDEQGKPCNERQRETFLQTLGKLEAEIILTDAGGEEDVLAGEEDPEGTGGEFLAAAKGGGLYMDQEQMKNWLSDQGISWSIRAVCLKIRSREYADLARDALEKAGYTAEIKGLSTG